MAKIFLFNPPSGAGAYIREGRCTQKSSFWATQWPPVTLATAAAFLDADGHEIAVRDFPALRQGLVQLEALVNEMRPDWAIWATGSPTLADDVALARRIKALSPATGTAVMGTHVTALPSEALAEAALDAVIRGEPEGTIRALAQIATAATGRASLADLAGISYRDGGGRIVHNPDAPWLDPAVIPAPAWQFLDLRPYRLPLKRRPFLIVAPIRGCPYPCSFCTGFLYYGRALRRRPVAQVLAEIEGNRRRFGVDEFFFWADTFTADRRYVRDLCRGLIEGGLKIRWTCNSRVDTVDAEMLRLMREAGLWMISFGIESAAAAVLERSGKGITAEQSRNAVTLAHGLGLKTAGHFLFGLPGETEATMAETLHFALTLPLDVAQFYAAAPFPGTPLYREALREGWLPGARSRSADGPAATAPAPMSDDAPPTWDIAAHGALQPADGPLPEGQSLSQNAAVLNLPGLPPATVDAFRRRAYRRFYARPAALARLITLAR